jgi:hypothetical protein
MVSEAQVVQVCRCCKRVLKESFNGRCWECAGRPAISGYPPVVAGERAPDCTHAVPGEK